MKYVKLRDAIKDFLKESNLKLQDILDAMDESKEGAEQALLRRTNLSIKEVRALVNAISSKELNLLLFALQTFYISNPSGMYKGRIIIPSRDEVLTKGKASKNGLRLLMRELNITPIWAKRI